MRPFLDFTERPFAMNVEIYAQKCPFKCLMEVYAEKAFLCFKERLIYDDPGSSEKKQKVVELKS